MHATPSVVTRFLYVITTVLVDVRVQAEGDPIYYCSPNLGTDDGGGDTGGAKKPEWTALKLQTWDGMDEDHFYIFPDYAQNAVLRIIGFGNNRCAKQSVKIVQQGATDDTLTPNWVCCVCTFRHFQ